MADPPPAPAGRLRKGSKLDDATQLAVVLAFANARSVERCAARVGVTRKRVRDIYIELRDRLTGARFARWHRANIILPGVPDPLALIAMKAAFFDALAECHASERCYKNFAAGNRKARLCRACPLPARFTGRAAVREGLAAVDAVRAFYRALKIYGERGTDPVLLFRHRLIHTAVAAAAAQNTRKLRSGLPDPADKDQLSIPTLFETLVVDLIERPLAGE
jgi:hypothetical protein